MELRVLKKLFHEPALLCLGITFIVWWTGLGGRDLYLLPAFVFLLMYVYRICINEPLKIPVNLKRIYCGKNWLIFTFSFHVVIFLTFTILKYYSFSWNVWDVGNFSNKLYNIAQGRFYSSYLRHMIGLIILILQCLL